MSGRKRSFLRPWRWLSYTLILGTVFTLSLASLIRLQAPPEQGSVQPAAEAPAFTQGIPIREDLQTAVSVPQSIDETIPTAAEERINLLLIGQDTRESGSRARSDAMILCSIHPSTQTVTIISFLRDLYVRIPGYSPNRLNAAYAFGGMPLLKKTFSENFGISVNGCIEVDFQQFTRLVDLMGGVTLSLRQDEADFLNQHCAHTELTEGEQQLDGQQALAYVRIRKLDPDGDFSRTLRQRKLLTALMEQLRKCSLGEVFSVLSSLDDLISTDLTGTQITSYAAQLLPLLTHMEPEQLRIPADGTYTPKTIDGMEVLVADFAQTEAILHAAIGEE